MQPEETWYRWQDGALILNVRVQPRAKRDALIGPQGGYLKVGITAAPVDGKANAHLRRFLAAELGVPRSRVQVLAGAQARLKRIRVQAPRKLPDAIAPK